LKIKDLADHFWKPAAHLGNRFIQFRQPNGSPLVQSLKYDQAERGGKKLSLSAALPGLSHSPSVDANIESAFSFNLL